MVLLQFFIVWLKRRSNIHPPCQVLLKDNLTEDNFQRILAVIWESSAQVRVNNRSSGKTVFMSLFLRLWRRPSTFVSRTRSRRPTSRPSWRPSKCSVTSSMATSLPGTRLSPGRKIYGFMDIWIWIWIWIYGWRICTTQIQFYQLCWQIRQQDASATTALCLWLCRLDKPLLLGTDQGAT